MEEINQTENLEGTIPQEVPSAEPTESPSEEAAPQAEPETENSEGSETVPNAEPEAFLPISFNHESIGLSKDDAVKFAQLGMKYEKSGIDIDTVKPILNSLEYVAAQQDITVAELVNGIIAKDEENYRAELKSRFGDEEADTIEDLMQIRRNKQKEKYQQVLEDRKQNATKEAEERELNLNNRLANEFIELRGEFPEIAEFKDLPDEVKREAAKGRDLLSCYLRYKHNEERKIMAAKKTAEENSKATTGSGGSAEPTGDSVTKAMLSGLWR